MAKSIRRKTATVLLFLTTIVRLSLAQGVLIFEVSDPNNNRVSGVDITILQDGKKIETFTTDKEGRIICTTFPLGDYSYETHYGDYGKGTFSLTGNYQWIDLDYRAVNIHFLNDEGQPLPGKMITIYKIEDDDSEHYIGERLSDTKGEVSFILPKGIYKYSSLKGDVINTREYGMRPMSATH